MTPQYYHSVEHVLYIFFCRHWLLGVSNTLLTVCFGMFVLLAVNSFPLPIFNTLLYLRLKRFILASALLKGTFYMIVGDGRNDYAGQVVRGLQFPDPFGFLGIHQNGFFSIWAPTSARQWTLCILVTTALVMLALRLIALTQLRHQIDSLRAIDPHLSDEERVRLCVLEAAGSPNLNLRAERLPGVAVARLNKTPVVLLPTVPRAMIVCSPEFLAQVSHDELTCSMRHELAHYVQRDHWWRILFSFANDLSAVIGVTVLVGLLLAETEEFICDRLAVSSRKDAIDLGRSLGIANGQASLLAPRKKSPAIPQQNEGYAKQEQQVRILDVQHAERVVTSLTGTAVWRMLRRPEIVRRVSQLNRWTARETLPAIEGSGLRYELNSTCPLWVMRLLTMLGKIFWQIARSAIIIVAGILIFAVCYAKYRFFISAQ